MGSAQNRQIEQRLSAHLELGTIADWRKAPRLRNGWIVTLYGGKEAFVTPLEALSLILGLESAHAALTARRDAEERARAQFQLQEDMRRAEQREREHEAIALTGCPYCKSDAGRKCVRETEDPTPYADHPHHQRMVQAAILKGASEGLDAQGG